ncbi:hypothetical protein [Paenibacillus aceti]|uniref:Tail fiber protein n=1 Tax=Paenibacillus aceti TaxID=1820010 RepID=A0ABQ1VPG1_9BACL|nr:hypothetical protein [Paenibacillus aceti]GGF86956.1 hypothetical protein GCM10010913_05540 [Paenibacillus aceti]
MKTMYSAQANSPGTELAEAITAQQTTIKVVDPSAVLDGPNLLTIGTDESSETILYTKKNGTVLTGVTRGYQGKAQSWGTGIKVARYVTAYDHDTFKENIEDLYKQIDATDLTTTLGPGTSVINTDQASAVDMTVYGQTRVNLLGSYGNFEVDSNNDGLADGWISSGGASQLLSSEKVAYGIKAQRLLSKASNTTSYRYIYRQSIPISAGKKYVLIADAVTDGAGLAFMAVFKTNTQGGNKLGGTDPSSANKTHFVKIAPTEDRGDLMLLLYNNSPVPADTWTQWDGAGLYEVSDELYNRIGVDINETNIRDYLPHVDGVQHVQGASVYHPSKNLLPSLPDTLHANAKMTAPYELMLNAKGSNDASYITVPVMPNTTMVLKVEHNGKVAVATEDRSSNIVAHTSNQEVKFNTGSNRAVTIAFTNYAPSGSLPAGTYTFNSWQLEIGDKATPFEPAKPQQLIIPETLAEVAGYRDEVRVRLDKAELIRRVERGIKLTGDFPWKMGYRDYIGFKEVRYLLGSNNFIRNIQRAIKYTGKALNSAPASGTGTWTESDQVLVWDMGADSGGCALTIANSESGWVDSINPNPNAIKALMNGWKAAANDGSKYTSWISLLDGKAPATNTEAYVSTNKAPNWDCYATLDYALDKPEIKPIKTEGAISLHPGGNQLTVATGIIQREKVKLQKNANGVYFISGVTSTSKRTNRILQVYKEADPDPVWWIYVASNNGMAYAEAAEKDVDPNADYYVTYTTLDKYDYTANVTQLDVSYKAGISATLSDAVGNISELKTQNDRQDFADTYIQANVENNRKDIDALSDRLNAASTSKLTLQPGLQTIKAARDARFNIGSIKGKSEINGQGRRGIIGVENPYIFRRASKSADAEILSMLAFQTELHANPDTGADADELYEKNGQYFRRAKWRKVVLDGTQPFTFRQSRPGLKEVWIDDSLRWANQGNAAFAIKYDGTQMKFGSSANLPAGQIYLDINSLLLSISNADSGWGDAYTPTADEIKAYFNGWRMCDGNTSQLYTGAVGEVKCWGAIAHPSNVIGSNGWFGYVLHDVPTCIAPVTGGYEYHPYNLLYRLGTDVVEPVAHEGCLTLSEGDNAIEVGTGIVLRERTNPYINTGLGYVGINAPSSPNYPGSGLKNKLDRFLEIFKNSAVDKGWNVQKANYGGGNEYADISLSSYDPSAAYSVTYLKLDKSPVVPITGEIAANEKAQLVDLTAGVAEALHGVSVLAMEKAEKDAPGWITPTLLNGWIRYGAKGTIAKYYKDQFGLVHIVGLISNGVLGTVVFQLPVGYRPKLQYNFGIVGSNIGTKVPMHCSVNPTGEIIVQGTANEWTSLDGIVFEAEQ